jgi:hypothetical protein
MGDFKLCMTPFYWVLAALIMITLISFLVRIIVYREISEIVSNQISFMGSSYDKRIKTRTLTFYRLIYTLMILVLPIVYFLLFFVLE